MLAEDSNYLQLGEAVKAVIFLNGPQRKSTMVPWTTLLLQITRENLLADPRLEGIIRAWLEKNASPLEKLPLRFKKRSSGIKIISFYGPLGPLHLVCCCPSNHMTSVLKANKSDLLPGY